MDVLIYATTFGADLLSMAYYLEEKKGVNLKISLPNLEVFKNEPITRLYPLKSELIERNWKQNLGTISGFKPNITLMDNSIPLRKTSPKALMLWHGYGWKGTDTVKEFKWVHKNLRVSWGDMMVPNPDMSWLCFGPFDFEYRTKVSGFHPDNCKILGAASHDQLRTSIDKKNLQPYYPFDIINKKTILFAPTWHYGEVFAHWGRDTNLLKKLIQKAEEKDCNLILRVHDTDRYEPTYIEFLRKLKDEHPNLVLKFKNQNPDNFLDMQVADIMMTNFSSIANLFYATKRPTLHIYPVANEDEEFLFRKKTIFGQVSKKIDSVKFLWKSSPEDNGGLLAHSFDELISQLEYALEHPDCCAEKAQDYLDRHMIGADGKNRDRIWAEMNRLVQ